MVIPPTGKHYEKPPEELKNPKMGLREVEDFVIYLRCNGSVSAFQIDFRNRRSVIGYGPATIEKSDDPELREGVLKYLDSSGKETSVSIEDISGMSVHDPDCKSGEHLEVVEEMPDNE
ncbi:MAG: hypothetical protein HGB08_00825 [Candidatus Moranbacteria bacterium]|nr:hypothetical protein [Candidatus Moranbacteria bacterium]